MSVVLAIILIAAAAVVSGVLFFIIGMSYRKKVAEKQIGSAEQEANKIVSEAMKNAEAKKKEAILELQQGCEGPFGSARG